MRTAITLAIFSLFLSTSTAVADSELSKMPAYQPRDLGEAKLSSVGSDSMGGLVERWMLSYRTLQPEVQLQVTSRGSALAPSALIDGSADLGPMARPMKQSELSRFKRQLGFEPTQIRTAVAGIGIYVSENNPLTEISLAQLDAIFSASRFRSEAPKQLTTWNELGVGGALGVKPISLAGGVTFSYANSYFKQRVLLQGDYVEGVQQVSDVEALAKVIASNETILAYGLYTKDVPEGLKLLAVRPSDGKRALRPTTENILSGDYPIGRTLNIYIAKEPEAGIDSATKDFLRFVLSQQGQRIVAQQGLTPLPNSVLRTELAKLAD